MEKRETNEKGYYNNNLEPVLKKYITREQYGDFAIVLEDIFQRRAYEFELSPANIEEEVSNFVNRVSKVEFSPKEEMYYQRAMGVYIPAERTIRLNQDYYLKQMQAPELEFGSKLYATLTHEVYHGIADRGDHAGLKYAIPGDTNWRGSALDEVFTETAANRASFSRGAKEAEQYRADTDGYPDITFVTNLLAASVGLTEKEILRAGIQNRGQLMTAISSKFPEGKPFNEAYEMIQKMESSLDVVYNIIYSDEQKTNDQRNVDNQLMGSSLVTLYDTAFKLASHQIENDTRPISEQTLADATYRYSKIERIMRDSLVTFKNYNEIPMDFEPRILSCVENSRKALANRVSGFDALVRQGQKITNPRDFQRAQILAKKGLLPQNAQILNNLYGVRVSEGTPQMINSITDNMEYHAYVMKEDFDNGEQWDNKSSAIVMKRIFVNDMERKGLIRKNGQVDLDKTEELPVIGDTEELPVVEDDRKAKGLFGKLKDSINTMVTRFKNRNQKKLYSGEQVKTTREQDNSEYYASLATKTVEENSAFSKYRVEGLPSLKVENLNVGTNKIEKNQSDKDYDDER